MEIYKVGGCVRDSVLQVKPKDIDYAVEAPSFAAMVEAIKADGFTVFLETPEFFTVRARFPNSKEVADFVLCREEIGGDGRHPLKIEPGTIHLDLARRDFTMNAIAINLKSNELIDPFNGQQDIKNKIIRCVGNPEDRLQEDALRVLRALRFSITLGFEIDHRIWEVIQTKNHVLTHLIQTKVSSNRIREELEKMFIVNSLQSLNLLARLPLNIREVIFKDDLWLKPTSAKK